MKNLIKGKMMNDDKRMRFAGACTGIAISLFQLPLNPPKPGKVRKLIAG